MKKSLIGGLIGGLVLFIWQFLSWGPLQVHSSNMDYTPKQDQIIECLRNVNLEDGEYYVPRATPDASQADAQEFSNALIGKSWAKIEYHNNYQFSFGMNLFRGFVIDFLAAFLLCFLLMGDNNLTFMKVLTGSIMVGLISYLTIAYLDSIWFESNSIPHLIDAIVGWGLTGAALGWWLAKK